MKFVQAMLGLLGLLIIFGALCLFLWWYCS